MDKRNLAGIICLTLGAIIFIFSLFFRIVTLSGIAMFIFSLFSIFFGLKFFPDTGIARTLILISGVIYLLFSIFLIFRLKKWIRKLMLTYLVISILYFLPVSIYLSFDPWGWGGVMALALSPYIFFPLFFIIFLTRPQVKEQFKK